MKLRITRQIELQHSAPSACLILLGIVLLFTTSRAWGQLVPGSMDVHWSEGAADCSSSPLPPLQVHQYNTQTFILRQNLCATFEAPFLYLLIGSNKALLIDTGDVAEPERMPLASTVRRLLPGGESAAFPLLVVHTHRHLDHRAGDGQFTGLPNVQVVGFDIDSVRRFYQFTEWPNGLAQIDLGDRIVDVIPTPGHNQTEVSFYDRNTGLFFSGDFLLPGRLMIDDTSAAFASAERVAAFVKDHPISFVLGAHIEMNAREKLFSWQSQYHPDEHILQITKDDVLALPEVIRSFNGFYTTRGKFILTNPIRMLVIEGVLAGLVLLALLWVLIRFVVRRRQRRKLLQET